MGWGLSSSPKSLPSTRFHLLKLLPHPNIPQCSDWVFNIESLWATPNANCNRYIGNCATKKKLLQVPWHILDGGFSVCENHEGLDTQMRDHGKWSGLSNGMCIYFGWQQWNRYYICNNKWDFVNKVKRTLSFHQPYLSFLHVSVSFLAD